MIMLMSEDFRNRDIYIDYSFEDRMFRWEKETQKVYCRRYGEREVEINHTSEFFNEAISAGREIDRDEYFVDYPPSKAKKNVVLRFIRLLRP